MVLGADERTRVTPTVAPPFRYICNLEFDGWAVGTGTLIGPRTVLTAGHCVHYADETLLPAAKMRVVPGRNGSLEPLPVTTAVSFRPYPGYRRVSPTDLALIHLAHPIGNRVGWWRRTPGPTAPSDIGTSMSPVLPGPVRTLRVTLSGYPADMPAARAFNCRRPSGRPCEHSAAFGPPRNRVRCGTEQWQSTNRLANTAVAGMLVYLNDTCPGHSGSPVWVTRPREGGGRCMVGVHVDRARTNDANLAARFTPAVLSWLRQYTR